MNNKKSKAGKVLIIIGLILILLAAALFAYNLWDSKRAEAAVDQAGNALISEIQKSTEDMKDILGSGMDLSEITYPDYYLNPTMEMKVKNLDGRDYVGLLEIPSLGLSLPVLADWSYPGLKKAPCRYSGTAYQGNLVIAAHNYKSHFGTLKTLVGGETVNFMDIDGNLFTYQVAETEILEPTAIEEMVTGDWDLTLFTCTLGGAARVTVRCRLTGEAWPVE